MDALLFFVSIVCLLNFITTVLLGFEYGCLKAEVRKLKTIARLQYDLDCLLVIPPKVSNTPHQIPNGNL